MILEKPKREKSEAYLEYIRSLPCLLTRFSAACDKNVDAHHVTPKGHGKVGSKSSDREAVPLCRFHHNLFHLVGLIEFESRFGLILNYEILRLQRAYKPPVKAKREKTLPRIRHTAVDCVCGRTHKLTPAKFNDGSFFCPIRRQRVDIA